MFVLALLVLLTVRIAYTLPLNSPLLPSYDYIGKLPDTSALCASVPKTNMMVVVGGGPAGLTVANRLSGDPNVNVLLLEAGPADHGEPSVELPGMIGDEMGGIYDWNMSTVSQTYLNGLPRTLPQGRGLGGGTLINGMLWNRGGVGDYDAWVQLGNDGWAWDDLLPYFKKSETYTPISSVELAMQFSIEDDPSVHGSDGPVNVSFPSYLWNASGVLFEALNELGVPTAFDPNTGQIAGASFLPLDLDPATETRSTARKAYYDPVTVRPNLWVNTGQYVTQVLFAGSAANVNASVSKGQDSASVGQGASPGRSGSIYGGGTLPTHMSDPAESQGPRVRRSYLSGMWNKVKRALMPRQGTGVPAASSADLRAVGVEYAPDSQNPRQNVSATREVIIAAGALHSPQILMLSGIGPAAALQALQIPVHVDLPGVGSNLHDHSQVWCWYPYYNASYLNPTMLTSNDTFATDAWSDFWASTTGPLTSSAIDGVAFPPLPLVMNGSTVIADAASAQSPQQFLPANTDPTVAAGFTAQLPLLIEALSDSTRAGYEIINANDGALTIGNMRPLSRGTVTLSSPQPFDPPAIDPRYGSNPVDAKVLVAAMRFNERLLNTAALSEMDPLQLYPPVNSTDDELLQYINRKLQTEYHPAGSCAMMPEALGGVVSPELLVHGTSNLRVVDASIIPMLPAAHLQAVVYGIAEKVGACGESVPFGILADSRRPPTSSKLPTTWSPLLLQQTPPPLLHHCSRPSCFQPPPPLSLRLSLQAFPLTRAQPPALSHCHLWRPLPRAPPHFLPLLHLRRPPPQKPY